MYIHKASLKFIQKTTKIKNSSYLKRSFVTTKDLFYFTSKIIFFEYNIEKEKGKKRLNSQKIDNQLNLALDSTEQEREKSLDLNIGFDPQNGRWDLIVKYSGDLTPIEQGLGAKITYLMNGYAIVNIEENKIDALSNITQVEFIEKPRGLVWEQYQELVDSCITPVRREPYELSGRGVLIAVIDSGIDYTHPEFRNRDGSTRIAAIWDQTIQGQPPEGYGNGTLYSKEYIDEALKIENSAERLEFLPTVDLSGHGTHVAGIAAGKSGVAPDAELLIVKLGTSKERSFPRTTELMEAVNFCVQFALEKSQPIVLNLSFGNNYGGHDGSSLLETFLDEMSFVGRNVIVCGSGNEGASNGHAGGNVIENQIQQIEFSISDYEPSISIQLWKSYSDSFGVYLTNPSNERIGPVGQVLGTQRFTLGNTRILIYFGEPSPYNRDQEIYFEFLPIRDYVDSGIWTIELLPEKVVTGRYDFWLPVAEATGGRSRFLYPDENVTLTVPSTANKVITVSAYDSALNGIAYFSGRGFTRRNQIKPDLCAPGVDIRSASPGGGYSVRSGTSMATPFVSGSSALLMQYGIIEGRDPYLYGEKIKAYLIRGAKQFPIFEEYPNQVLGYGALCLFESMP